MADSEISRTFCRLQTPTSVPHPFSVSHTAAAEGWGSFGPVPPGSRCLRVPRDAADWHPDCQPDDGFYHESQKWQGEVRLQEWPLLNLRTRGRCSQLPPLSERVACRIYTTVYMQILYAHACRNKCLWMALSLGAFSASTFFLIVFFYFFPKFSIWTQSLSLAARCAICVWKLTKYQHSRLVMFCHIRLSQNFDRCQRTHVKEIIKWTHIWRDFDTTAAVYSIS